MKLWAVALLKLVAVLSMAGVMLLYGLDVKARRGAKGCERETVGRYIGETCYISREHGALFRLYDSKSGELLAERMYYDLDSLHMVWFSDLVQYDLGDEDSKGYVSLPPTWLDRLRARLP